MPRVVERAGFLRAVRQGEGKRLSMQCIAVLMPIMVLFMGASSALEYAMPSYAHLQQKIDAGEDITVVYLGGSITYGAMTYPPFGTNAAGKPYDYRAESDPERFSWRARTFAWLRENYEKRPGQFRMVNAAVGATDSELGAYRLARHVLAYKPDLLFIEFAINDNGVGKLSDNPEADRSIYRTLSSMVSRVREANPEAAVFIPVSTARRLDPAVFAYFQPARTHHMRFAEMFHLPYLDIQQVFYEMPLPEGVTVDNVFDGPANAGCGVHPSPLGHRAYAEGVCRALEDLLTRHRFDFAKPRRAAWFEPYPRNPRFLPAEELPQGDGWVSREGKAFAQMKTHVCRTSDILFTDRPGSRFTLPFKGTAVYLWGQQHYPGLGNISGRLVVSVDGVRRAVFSDGDHRVAGDQLLQRMMPVARDLEPAVPHVLEVTASPMDDGTPTRIGLHGIGIDQPPVP